MTDMGLDTSRHTVSELQAASLYPIDPSRRDAMTERYKAVCKGCHACLQLAGTETAHLCWGYLLQLDNIFCSLPSLVRFENLIFLDSDVVKICISSAGNPANSSYILCQVEVCYRCIL